MNSLFHQDVLVSVLSSGSSGNCTLVSDGHHGVLIDCGVSTRQILARMDAVGLGHVQIDAVLLTHEHSDHVAAAAVLQRRLSKGRAEPVPVYATSGTLRGMADRCRPEHTVTIRAGSTFQLEHKSALGPWRVRCFPVPHDAHGPVGYALEVGSTRVGLITDLGRPTRAVSRVLRTLDIAVVEFNHDEEMLLDGPYPWPLKQRIHSGRGHLSNRQAMELVADGVEDRLSHLVLAHLSEENNSPDRARERATEALWRAGREDVTVTVAEQHRALAPLSVRTALA